MEYMFMPLKRYAEFSGRSRRMEYWMFVLFQIILWFVLMALFVVIAGSAMLSVARGNPAGLIAAGGSVMVVGALAVIIWLALLIPAIAVGIRRLHDTDRSGWWLGGFLILYFGSVFIPRAAGGAASALGAIVGIVILVYAIGLFVLMLLDGTKGPNKYGPDPKAVVDAQVFA
jgi:uncharacterized membrane protein YhaH (DUF805 family)